MLQPEYYLLARHEARFHVLLEITSAGPAAPTPGPMPLEGVVLRAYRTDGALRVGDHVRLAEHVMRPGDDLPCGGIRWKPHDEVASARYLEAFLNGDPPDCEVALSQSVVLAEPGAGPRMRGWYPITAARIRARRAAAERPWWRFWA